MKKITHLTFNATYQRKYWCQSNWFISVGSAEDRKYMRYEILNQIVDYNIIVSTWVSKFKLSKAPVVLVLNPQRKSQGVISFIDHLHANLRRVPSTRCLGKYVSFELCHTHGATSHEASIEKSTLVKDIIMMKYSAFEWTWKGPSKMTLSHSLFMVMKHGCASCSAP